MTAEEEARCLRAALRLLKYRPRSRKELEERLRRRGFSPEAIAQTVLRLAEEGVIDDREFARLWVESRRALNPRSRRLLEVELRGKGIAPEDAAAAVEGLDDEETAYRLGVKRARSLAAADYATFRRRLGSYLYRRGFSWSLIARTVDRLWREVRS